MKPYTYLSIDFMTVIVCFLFSFDKRIQFYRSFGAVLKGALLVGISFIAWDVWFTARGIWWFSAPYTIGIGLLGLPIEEWLFFLCIPFSCLFTFYCLDRFFNLDWAEEYLSWFLLPVIVICLAAAFVFHDRMYPFVTGLLTAGTLIYLKFIAKANWIGKASLVYLVLMLGFLPVNGLLSGTGLSSPVVNYNPKEILNVRILTIPIEDFVYGYALFTLNVYYFTLFKKRALSQRLVNDY